MLWQVLIPHLTPGLAQLDAQVTTVSEIYMFHLSSLFIRCHAFNFKVFHISIRDGTINPRIEIPSNISPRRKISCPIFMHSRLIFQIILNVVHY
jgi:hypothetical protein